MRKGLELQINFRQEEVRNGARKQNNLLWGTKGRNISGNFFLVYVCHGETNAADSAPDMSRNNLESGFDKGAVEAAWSFPLGNYKYLKGYIQGFTGYGQSLIDYDSKETSIGIGFAVTDVL
jgi:hypothetical protein